MLVTWVDFRGHNNTVIGSRDDPRTLRIVQRQAVSRAFDKGECNGVWKCIIRKAPAVLLCISTIRLWLRKSPHVTEILRFIHVRI